MEEEQSLFDGILSKLRPFQREAVDFATKGTKYERQFRSKLTKDTPLESELIGKGRILLADEMGTGKTITSLAIMAKYETEWPLLVLCPASLKHTWPSEIEKFFPSLPPQSIYVAAGFNDIKFAESRDNGIRIVIVAYSLVQQRSAVARVLNDFKCIIADESHNLKQRESQRSQFLVPILLSARRLVLLTGTPALARPADLWTQLHCLAPQYFGGWNVFSKRYCNPRLKRIGARSIMDYSGSCNEEELHQKLKSVMVRRLKCDVLSELPPKQRSIVPVYISKEEKAKCQQMMKELGDARKGTFEEASRNPRSEVGRKLMAAYAGTGAGKAQAVADYLLDWLKGSSNQKILVFCHHQSVMDILDQKLLEKFPNTHIRIDGKVPTSVRAQLVRKFQTCARVRLGLLSMTAAGVGLTLTAASTVLFAELHWTPGVLTQAEDRAHRIGQAHSSVQILYMICKDSSVSVDNMLWDQLGRKIGTLGQIIDGSKEKRKQFDSATAHSRCAVPSQNAQEELVTFFTEQHDSEKKRPVAKGSIQSFFNGKHDYKRSHKSRDGLASTPRSHHLEETLGKKRNWVCDVCTYENSTPTGKLECSLCGSKHGPKKMKSVSTRSRLSDSRVSWSCSTCTYNNSSSESANGRYFCDLCGEPHKVAKNSVRVSLSPRASTAEPTIINALGSVGSNGIVVVDDSSDDEDEATGSDLMFSVSKNSGRVAMHYSDEKHVGINFSIEQVLTADSADSVLRSRTKWTAIKAPAFVHFVPEAVSAIVEVVDVGTITSRSRHLQAFVCNFLELPAAEQKALSDSGRAFHPNSLAQQVAALATKETQATTDRFVGGAKERAKKREESGEASENDLYVLQGKACAWCGSSLMPASLAAKSVYCSQVCAEEGRLRRGGRFASQNLRTAVFAVQGGVCCLCKVDAHELFRLISSLQPSERLNKLLNMKWRLPRKGKALERLLQEPTEGDFWQVDHIIPVAEGGGDASIDNLRTLCTPCHLAETQKLRSRLKIPKVSSRQRRLSSMVSTPTNFTETIDLTR